MSMLHVSIACKLICLFFVLSVGIAVPRPSWACRDWQVCTAPPIPFAAGGRVFVSNREGGRILVMRNSLSEAGIFAPDGLQGNHSAQGLVWGPDRNLYVTATRGDNTSPKRVLKLDGKTGRFLSQVTVVQPNVPDNWIGNLKFGPDGNLYITDVKKTANPPQVNDNIGIYDPMTGAFLGNALATPAGFPEGFAWDQQGFLYVGTWWAQSGGDGGTISKYDTTGELVDTLYGPVGDIVNDLKFGPDGNLFASLYFSGEVLIINPNTGALIKTLGGGLSGARGMDFDKAGNLLVASYFENAIRVYRRQGGYKTTFAVYCPNLSGPTDLDFVPYDPVTPPETAE